MNAQIAKKGVKMADCKCGKKVIAKGLCRSCYYKDRNARIKSGEWTPTPIVSASVPIDLDDDEKYATKVMKDFHDKNHYYGRGEELLHSVDKEMKQKLAKGIRTLGEKNLTKVSIIPSKKLLSTIPASKPILSVVK
jgi:hypothetical protein